MSSQYYILYYPGAGGMFLTSILSQAANLPVKKNNISAKGDCHNLGTGVHTSTDYHDLAGWSWWTNEFKNKFCINGHYNNLAEVKKTHPNIKVVLIGVDDSDIHNMIALRFQKTLNPMIRPVEYDKFVRKFNITDWPSKQEVLTNPELIKDSFIGYDRQWFKEWQNEIDFTLVDIVVSFKSLFGLNDISLESVLKKNFSVDVDETLSQYIKTYQEKNLQYITL